VIIVRTPLRVSLFGGGTDFPDYFKRNGGAVIGSAIDKYIYHTVSKFPSWLFEHKIRFSYRVVEQVSDVELIQHKPFREILKYHGISENIEINLASDLPSFTGLGSSSAFTVGLVKGLNAFQGRLIDMASLAQLAIHLERNVLGEAVGLQDQIFASYGGFNHIRFSGHDGFEVERINVNQDTIQELSDCLMMYYTGMTRRASDIEEAKLKNMDRNMAALDRMHECVGEALAILSKGEDLDDLGYLLDESWRLKRHLGGDVTNPKIDDIYRHGIESGALGGKLLGAGGGGFFLFYVPKKSRARFREAFSRMHEVPFSFNAQGSAVIHAGA
jgi:D-glycero-alpha-D-manno-heptose-7-phosphate kinase